MFDKNYLSFGVALWHSLERNLKHFKLYCLCMDEVTFRALKKMNRENLIPISFTDFASEELTRKLPELSPSQRFWICESHICQFILDKFEVEHVIYVDADCFFFSSPQIMLEEIEQKKADVAISPHNYAEMYAHLAEKSGHFCVQFNYFRNTENARKVLKLWQQECFKYHKDRPYEYPGQQCLDRWPDLPGVHIIQNLGAGVAPWNAIRFSTPADLPGGVVFYHFHALYFLTNGLVDYGHYRIPPWIVDSCYKPYIQAVLDAEKEIKSLEPEGRFLKFREPPPNLFSLVSIANLLDRNKLREIYIYWQRRFSGTYQTLPINNKVKGDSFGSPH